MEIMKVEVSKINPARYNPRKDLKPGDAEYEKLRKSMKEFGYVEPIVWNQLTGNLVGGHQRLKVLIEQGFNEVEAVVINESLAREKALNLALNKIQGQWDEEKLAQLLTELSAIPEFDVGITGFESAEISELLDSFAEPKEENDFDIEAAVKNIETSVTKRGDLIELGPHRILCGDSSDSNDVKNMLGEFKISLLHIDPPYNVAYYGGNRPNASSRPSSHKLWERIYSDNMTQEEYETWLKKILTNISPYLDDGAPIYIWNGHKQFGPMYLMLRDLGFHISCVLTWAKENFAFGYGDYSQQTEFCLYGWKNEGGPHNWYGPTNESTLWQVKRDPTKSYIHPTQKPIALPQRAIRNSSKRGDIVADLFLGSGSTLIACESLERRCFGMEIDARYCDAIVRRYIAYAGEGKVSEDLLRKYKREAHHVEEC